MRRFYYYLTIFIITIIAIITTSIATAQDNYLQEGKEYYDRGQYTEAVQLWQKVANTDKTVENKIISYNYLAIAYQDLRQFQEAQTAVDKALNLLQTNSNSFLYAQVLNTQGSLQYKTGLVENALKTWQQAETIYQDLNEVQSLLRS